MSDDIRNKVDETLSAARVAYSATYRGEKKNALSGSHPMDEWECAFSYPGSDLSEESFAFFTGFGHRKPDESVRAKMSALSLAKVSKRMLAWEQHYKKYPDKPQNPHAADVLYSLILDSSACEQSFANWCEEYGYDSDSRKALSIYEACQENADKMRRIFTREQVEALREALGDY